MKIKQYIVTYDNDVLLQKCIDSMIGASHEICIIDNFGNCAIDTHGMNITIIRNSLRPTFSTGHLAKDWNSALILAFEDLTDPKCDIAILNQNDVVFKPNYVSDLIKLHEQFDFIQMGSGDEMMSFTPTSVRQIGLFDERFCNIGFQEADYILRARLYCEKITINDINHDRFINPLSKEQYVIEDVVCGHNREEVSTIKSSKYHPLTSKVFHFKWPWHSLDRNWSKWPADHDWSTIKPTISFISYPYFEEDILTLQHQNFLL